MPQPVTLHRVIVQAPITHIPTGPTTGITVTAPPADSFDPTTIRITQAAHIRPGDTVLGTIQPHYDTLLNPLDRAQWVSYFSNPPRPQRHGARPWNPAHCELCAHNGHLRAARRGQGWVTVDGCTMYRGTALLLTVPRELATSQALEPAPEPCWPVADTVCGVGIVDTEDGYIALTHDTGRAVAAIRQLHRSLTAGVFAHDLGDAPDLVTGWVRFDHRPDGPWTVPCAADVPGAHPATFLYL